MIPTITVDARQAYARFSQAGIPNQVRNNLRALLPQLGKRFGDSVESKLDSDLKSRTTLTVKKLMVENPSNITMRISMISPSAEGLLPTYLESGTRAHGPVTANFLHFFIDGNEIFTKWVKGVGERQLGRSGGYKFMERTLAEFESNIVGTLDRAVKENLNP